MHAIYQLQSMLLIPFSSTYNTILIHIFNCTFSWSLSIFSIQKYYFSFTVEYSYIQLSDKRKCIVRLQCYIFISPPQTKFEGGGW